MDRRCYVPRLVRLLPAQVIRTRFYRVTGFTESDLDALIAFRGQKQMLKEDRSAGSGGGDSKVLRRVIGQAGLPIFS